MTEGSTSPEKTKEKPAPADSAPVKRGGCRGCFKVLGAAVAVLFFIFLLISGAVALAVAATGLVKIPVLSSLIKPPAITEDFSYKKVSEKKLGDKLEAAMSGTEGNVRATITLTDDEVNTIIAGIADTPDSAVKSLLVKFRPGVIKISGVLTKNDTPIYAELLIAKSATTFEFEFQRSRLGALPLPGFLVEGLIGQLVGTGQLLGKPTAEAIPAKTITVRDGSIVIKGLDLSGLGGGE